MNTVTNFTFVNQGIFDRLKDCQLSKAESAPGSLFGADHPVDKMAFVIKTTGVLALLRHTLAAGSGPEPVQFSRNSGNIFPLHNF